MEQVESNDDDWTRTSHFIDKALFSPEFPKVLRGVRAHWSALLADLTAHR